MREMIKMVVILTLLSGFSGALLSALKIGTSARIERQALQHVQGPAIRRILKGATNDPITDRFSLEIGGKSQCFFVGKFKGNPRVVAFETKGAGYGGDLGIMVGIDMETGKFTGIGVMTNSETAGIGTRVETDDNFIDQFAGLPAGKSPRVMKAGGTINAVTGAPETSRAVAAAVIKAGKLYKQNESRIKAKARTFSG